MNKYQEILKQYWGYDSFRDLQEEIITSIGEGKDTLGLMPTGGGKSITFQVPALAQEGICIVITPLIALMKDQVQNLRKREIKALAIYSGMTRQEILTALENCIFGNYKFLYISPERLDTEIFRTKLRSMKVSMITVDESHCISQWGYDFRPAYLKIAEIRELLPEVPVLALTATATPEVVTDIQARLKFREGNVFRMSFERKNLAYIVRKTDNKTKEIPYILRTNIGQCHHLCPQQTPHQRNHRTADKRRYNRRLLSCRTGQCRQRPPAETLAKRRSPRHGGNQCLRHGYRQAGCPHRAASRSRPTLSKLTSRKPVVQEETEKKPMPSSYTPKSDKNDAAQARCGYFPRQGVHSQCLRTSCSTTTRWQWATVSNVSASSIWKSSAGSSNTFRFR